MDAGREMVIPVALESGLPTPSNENQAWAADPKSWALPCTLRLKKHPDCEFAQLSAVLEAGGLKTPGMVRDSPPQPLTILLSSCASEGPLSGHVCVRIASSYKNSVQWIEAH